MTYKNMFAVFALALATGPAIAHADEVQYSGAPMVTLYALPNYGGRRLVLHADARKLKKLDFAASAMSMKVSGGRWEVCDRKRYKGACEVFGPGNYNLASPGWSRKIKSVRRFHNDRPEITLFSLPDMNGEHHSWTRNVSRLKDFISRASVRSVKVRGGEWTLCDKSKGKGRCETIDEDVKDLAVIHLGGRVLSVFRAEDWYARKEAEDNGSPGGAGYGFGSGGGGTGYDRDRHAQIVLYEGLHFTGARISMDRAAADLRSNGFSNRARSVRVSGAAWELCNGASFTKSCSVVRQNMEDLGDIGLDSLTTSVRPVPDAYGGRHNTASGGFDGQRTVFFAQPALDGKPVPSGRNGGSPYGQAEADGFCRARGFRRAVYYDEVHGYPQPYLIDVLCLR